MRPDLQWTRAIPLRGGAANKIGAFAKRSEMECFAAMLRSRNIGGVRALTHADADMARQERAWFV
jgi:hypothetical protein